MQANLELNTPQLKERLSTSLSKFKTKLDKGLGPDLISVFRAFSISLNKTEFLQQHNIGRGLTDMAEMSRDQFVGLKTQGALSGVFKVSIKGDDKEFGGAGGYQRLKHRLWFLSEYVFFWMREPDQPYSNLYQEDEGRQLSSSDGDGELKAFYGFLHPLYTALLFFSLHPGKLALETYSNKANGLKARSQQSSLPPELPEVLATELMTFTIAEPFILSSFVEILESMKRSDYLESMSYVIRPTWGIGVTFLSSSKKFKNPYIGFNDLVPWNLQDINKCMPEEIFNSRLKRRKSEAGETSGSGGGGAGGGRESGAGGSSNENEGRSGAGGGRGSGAGGSRDEDKGRSEADGGRGSGAGGSRDEDEGSYRYVQTAMSGYYFLLHIEQSDKNYLSVKG